MSTGSIFHNIEIVTREDAEALIEALEKSERTGRMERLTGRIESGYTTYEDTELTPEQIEAQQQDIESLKNLFDKLQYDSYERSELAAAELIKQEKQIEAQQQEIDRLKHHIDNHIRMETVSQEAGML